MKGFGAILATCDAAREKESAKELVNLVQQALEVLKPTIALTCQQHKRSHRDALNEEVQKLKQISSSGSQVAISVQTVSSIILITMST